jgi:hypothetical protein
LRVGLKRNCEALQARREDTTKVRSEADAAGKFFAVLVRESAEIARGVRAVDLEGPVGSLAAAAPSASL